MSYRWVVCPVVDYAVSDPESGNTSHTRAPKIHTIAEPGRGGKGYQFSAIIDAADWCLCYVRAADFSALDTDNQVVNLLGETLADTLDILSQTPRGHGWNQAKLNQLKNRLTAQVPGLDVSGVTLDMPFEAILDLLGRVVGPWASSRRTRC